MDLLGVFGFFYKVLFQTDSEEHFLSCIETIK